MTTADSAGRIFCLETEILFTGSGIFSFRTMRIAEKVDVWYFQFPTESPISEKNRCRQSSIFFQDVLQLHQK